MYGTSRILPRIATILLVFLPAAVSADENKEATEAYRLGYAEVLERDWKAAVEAFDELVARHPDCEWRDDADFWRCYSRERLGEAAARIFECYEELVATHPESEWDDDARRNLVRVARQLAREGHPEYRERLGGETGEEDEDGSMAVLEALSEIGDEESIDVILREIDRTEDPHLRARMVDTLEDVDSPRVIVKLKLLFETDVEIEVRMTALETLGDLAEETADYLREVAADRGQLPELRAVALDELSNDEGSPELIELLRDVAFDESDEVALAAVEVLGDLETPEALAVLAELLAPNVAEDRRLQAFEAVAEHDSPQAIELLRATVAADPESELAWQVVSLLAENETPETFEALVGFAASGHPWRLRAAALEGLAEFESAAAVAAIGTVLADADDPRLRRAAIAALGETEHDDAVELLLPVARDDVDPRVRRSAVEALGEIDSPAARDALIQLLEK